MPIGHGDVKRQGSPKAIDKDGDYIKIRITLNVSPGNLWLHCFAHPSKFRDNLAHPKRTRISGNILDVQYPKSRIKEYLEQLDDYIDKANECYHRKIGEEEAKTEREQKKEAKKREELDEINKMLEGL